MVADLPDHQLRNLESFLMAADSFSCGPQQPASEFTFLHNVEPGFDGEAPLELLDLDQSALSFSALKPFAFNAPVTGLSTPPALDVTCANRPFGLFSQVQRPCPSPYGAGFPEPNYPSDEDNTMMDSWHFDGCARTSAAFAPGAAATTLGYFSSALTQPSAGISDHNPPHLEANCASPTTRAPARRRSTNTAVSPPGFQARPSLSNSSSCSFHLPEDEPKTATESKAPVLAAKSDANIVACQICAEPVDTNSIRKYIRCRKVCNGCRTSSRVMKGGKEMRFCQLCSWFHDIEKFDGQRHSCRNALAKHNTRRRSKTQVKRRASQD
jgi:hypothetical protein